MRSTNFLKIKRSITTGGHTAIEILIALSLVGALVLIIFKISEDVMVSVKRNQLTTSRDQTAAWIRQSAGNLRGLRASLKKPGNEQFYNCVCGQGTGCTSAQPYAFTLYDYSNTNAPIQMYYDNFGVPCNQTSPSCVIEVTTNFVAQCLPTLPSSDPTPPATCVGTPAEFIAVTYTVRQNPATLNQGQFLKTISGSVYTMVDKLAPAGSGVCP